MTDPTFRGTLVEDAMERLYAKAAELKRLQFETQDNIARLRRESDEAANEVARLRKLIDTKAEEIEHLQEALDERRKKFLTDVVAFGDTLYGVAFSR